MGRVWATKFELGRDPFLEKRVLTSLARKLPKNVCHSTMHPRFHFCSPFSFTLGLLGSSWSFFCVFHSCFWLLASFFPWMGGRFCSAGDWVVFLAFLELLVHFPFTFLEVSCVFTMAVKGHSRFWLSHWLLVSRTGYLGRFSLLWFVLTDKLRDCCFPHAVNHVVFMPWGCCRLLNSFSLFKLR